MKKITYRILMVFGIVGLAGMVSSCLKDNYTDFSKVGHIVEFLDGNGGATGFTNTSVPFRSGVKDSTFLRINVTGPYAPTTPTTVTFDYDDAFLAQFNAASVAYNALKRDSIDDGDLDSAAVYLRLPDSLFTLTTKTVTIPANQRVASALITTNPDKFDLAQTYVLPFTIETTTPGTTISGNFNHMLLVISVANNYEADYKVTGFVFHPSAPRAISAVQHIYTKDAVSCIAWVGDLGGPPGSGDDYQFTVTPVNATTSDMTNWVPVGATPKVPASGFMTADNPGGTDYTTSAPSAPGTDPYLSSTYNNTYDIPSQTFWAHYGYAVGGNGQGTYTRQFYTKAVRQ